MKSGSVRLRGPRPGDMAARAIYQSEGFRRVATEKHCSFGKRLVAETWELKL